VNEERIVEIRETKDGSTAVFTFDPKHPVHPEDFQRMGPTVPRYLVSVAGRLYDILSTSDLQCLRGIISELITEEAWDVAWMLQHIRKLDKVGPKVEAMKRKADELRDKLKDKYKVSCDPEIGK